MRLSLVLDRCHPAWLYQSLNCFRSILFASSIALTKSSQVTGVAAMNNARVLTRLRPLLERGADLGDVRALLAALPAR